MPAPESKPKPSLRRKRPPAVLLHSPRMALSVRVEDSGLRHVTYTQRGISRIRCGRGFRYVDPAGVPIRSAEILTRIQSLAIPPAWTDVWICVEANGHLQAVGRDARGRRQYRYHSLWREIRDTAKFGELLGVAQVLPALRLRVERDLALPQLPRQKVLAAVVWLLEMTLIRIGNEEYVRENQSFGLTTLLDLHSHVDGMRIRFEFRGKSGKYHVVDIQDPRVAEIVKQCQDLPGQELFQYVDLTGDRHDIASEDVNDYLQETGGPLFSAKDFRTWKATVYALDFLRNAGPPVSVAQAKETVARCMRAVAGLLGNTPAICRKSYVHPGVVQKYTARELAELNSDQAGGDDPRLSEAERVAVSFLRNLAQPAVQAQPA